MKRIISIVATIISFLSFCAAQNVNMTMTLVDAEGKLQVSTEVELRISVLSESETAVYIETTKAISNPYGVVHIALGSGIPLGERWENVCWDSTDKQIRIERKTDSGQWQLLSQAPMGAVPYTYHARTAERVTLVSPDGNMWELGVDNEGNTIAKMTKPADSPAYGTVDYLFDLKALPTIMLNVSLEEWNTLLHNYDLNRDNEECVHADIHFTKYGETHSLQDIGLRLRGNTSRVRPEGKYGEEHVPGARLRHVHLGFRFQKFHKDDPQWLLSGTDRFNLRWAHEDPSYVREVYGYDLMRRFGVYTTAKSSYCKVYLQIGDENPVYLGVSEMFECYDNQYLSDHVAKGDFAGDTGFMWKGSWGSGVGAFFDKADPALMGIENQSLVPEEAEAYTYDYKSKKKKLEEAKTQLLDFITKLNTLTGDEFRNWAEGKIDVDLLLRAMACEVATGHWDDVWGNGNNFYIYFDNDGDGRMRYLPYDMDNTLGTSSDMYDSGKQNPLEWGKSNLINKILTVDEWKERFIGYLYELCDPANDYIDPAKSAKRIEKWQSLVKDWVINDTGDDSWIGDRPANWGAQPQYRLLGDQNNFFVTKIQSIKTYCPR